MNPSYIIPVMLLLFLIFFTQKMRRKYVLHKIIRAKAKKRTSGVNEMIELAKRFVNRDCIVYTYNGEQLVGKIEEVGSTGIMLRSKKDAAAQLINADFILRIREHPLDKNGKKKSVVLD